MKLVTNFESAARLELRTTKSGVDVVATFRSAYTDSNEPLVIAHITCDDYNGQEYQFDLIAPTKLKPQAAS